MMRLCTVWHRAHIKAMSNAAHFGVPEGRQNLNMLSFAFLAKQTLVD
jgi:hypothetical protein